MDEMKELALPSIALVIAVVAVGLAISMGPLGVALALATLGVAAAVVYQYTSVTPPRKEEIILEDFSWWADIGEPGASLKSLAPPDPYIASQIVSSDLGVMAKNSDLLSKRLSLLEDRIEFQGLYAGVLSREVEKVTNALSGMIATLAKTRALPPDLTKSMDEQAAILDRTANKLFEFEKGKSEVVKIYIDPLRRAAEKLSSDLRSGAANIMKFEKRSAPPG
ncbi:MAG: hypothetical protein ACK4GQ_02755 [Candidatus Hadarchaeales archaeon]